MSDADSTGDSGSPGYPARLDIEYPEDGLNRTTTLFRIILVTPIAIVAGLVAGTFATNWQSTLRLGSSAWRP